MPRIHVTLSGHRIEYPDPTPELEAFLNRVTAMAGDPAVTVAQLIGLLYSKENPILDPTIFPERGAVTRAVLERDEYAVMQDLLFRKEVQQHGFDVDRIAARYTLTVAEAAERLGMHVSAVTKAIQTRRVSSWVKKGRYFLDPAGLAPLESGKRRGPAPRHLVLKAESGHFKFEGSPATFRVSYRVGHEGDTLLRLRTFNAAGQPSEPDTKRAPAAGELGGDWVRAHVLHGRGGKLRMFEIEPAAGETSELELGELFVRGAFRVTRKVNSAKAAREAWESQPSAP